MNLEQIDTSTTAGKAEVMRPSVEYLRSALAYDPDTGVIIWVRSESPKIPRGTVAGHSKASGYVEIRIQGISYGAHRIAWCLHHGEWPKDQIDHVNRIRNDNRICNLRECSNAENQQNDHIRADNTSGVTGVSYKSADRKWVAYINVGGRRHQLGRYSSRAAAIAAREEGKRLHHTFHPVQIRADLAGEGG